MTHSRIQKWARFCTVLYCKTLITWILKGNEKSQFAVLTIYNLIVCWFYSICFILLFGANWTYHHQKLHSPDSKLWYFEMYKLISTQLILSYIVRVGSFFSTWANGMVPMVSWTTETQVIGNNSKCWLTKPRKTTNEQWSLNVSCLPKEQRSFRCVSLQSRKCQGSIPNLIFMWLTTLHPCLQRLDVMQISFWGQE